MQNLRVLFTVLIGVTVPFPMLAQAPQLDPQQRAAMQESAMQQNKPAEFVLQHRTDLSLTEQQVAKLEVLAEAQRDSARVRQTRVVERMRTNPPSRAFVAAVGWSGSVDEAELREALCQQSATQVEMMLGIARDRQAVASVLTPVQVEQLPRLQTGDMMKALGRP